jgi:hypothetical protein
MLVCRTVEPLLYDMLNFTSDADREAAFRALQGYGMHMHPCFPLSVYLLHQCP